MGCWIVGVRKASLLPKLGISTFSPPPPTVSMLSRFTNSRFSLKPLPLDPPSMVIVGPELLSCRAEMLILLVFVKRDIPISSARSLIPPISISLAFFANCINSSGPGLDPPKLTDIFCFLFLDYLGFLYALSKIIKKQ